MLVPTMPRAKPGRPSADGTSYHLLRLDPAPTEPVLYGYRAQMTPRPARMGVEPATPEVDARPLSDPIEQGLDNAVEGCAGETWSALLVRHQPTAPRIRQCGPRSLRSPTTRRGTPSSLGDR